MLNGIIYFGSASHCDQNLYHGWLFAYDAETLQQKSIFCTTPDGPSAPIDMSPKGNPTDIGIQGGVWQAGQGIASDGDSLFFTTGNGGFQAQSPDEGPIVNALYPNGVFSYNANKGGNNYGNTVLKLDVGLNVRSYFTPADQWTLDDNDFDLGSGGVMVLPLQLGAYPNQLVTMGKDSMIFLLDRDALGGFPGDAPPGKYGTDMPPAIYTIGVAAEINPVGPDAFVNWNNGIWGGPAYFHGYDGNNNEVRYVFYSGNNISLRAFKLSNGTLTQTGQSINKYSFGGTTPVVSSNNLVPGSEIVWVVDRNGTDNNVNTVHLHAYKLSELISNNAGVHPLFDWMIGTWEHGQAYIVPTIMNGKVYVACEDNIGVFF